jgi:GNAT superfamily N-acetyltransferase
MRVVEAIGTDAIVSMPTTFDPTQIEEEHADVHVAAVDDADGGSAECSLWWSSTPKFREQRVGVIGHYTATSDAAARMLLDAACHRLARARCTCAVGPMDGSTWRRYRFVIDAGTEPPFFLEPQNPPQWPQQFIRAGFSVIASYCSALNNDLSQCDGRLDATESRLRSLGVFVRSLKDGEVELFFRRIYRVACIAFRNNPFFAELPEADFLRQYEKLIPFLRPELLLLAEQNAEVVGFLLALPDVLCQARGAPTDTFVVKTVAILPRREFGGLGTLLVGRVQQIGSSMGFRRCIGALMYDGNALVRNISNAYGKPIRRYALWSKEL